MGGGEVEVKDYCDGRGRILRGISRRSKFVHFVFSSLAFND